MGKTGTKAVCNGFYKTVNKILSKFLYKNMASMGRTDNQDGLDNIKNNEIEKDRSCEIKKESEILNSEIIFQSKLEEEKKLILMEYLLWAILVCFIFLGYPMETHAAETQNSRIETINVDPSQSSTKEAVIPGMVYGDGNSTDSGASVMQRITLENEEELPRSSSPQKSLDQNTSFWPMVGVLVGCLLLSFYLEGRQINQKREKRI